MAETLLTLGVPKERILVETESRTTRHEALIIKEMLAAHPVDHCRSQFRRFGDDGGEGVGFDDG